MPNYERYVHSSAGCLGSNVDYVSPSEAGMKSVNKESLVRGAFKAFWQDIRHGFEPYNPGRRLAIQQIGAVFAGGAVAVNTPLRIENIVHPEGPVIHIPDKYLVLTDDAEKNKKTGQTGWKKLKIEGGYTILTDKTDYLTKLEELFNNKSQELKQARAKKDNTLINLINASYTVSKLDYFCGTAYSNCTFPKGRSEFSLLIKEVQGVKYVFTNDGKYPMWSLYELEQVLMQYGYKFDLPQPTQIPVTPIPTEVIDPNDPDVQRKALEKGLDDLEKLPQEGARVISGLVFYLCNPITVVTAFALVIAGILYSNRHKGSSSRMKH